MRLLVATNFLPPYRVEFFNALASRLGEDRFSALFWFEEHPDHAWDLDGDSLRFRLQHCRKRPGAVPLSAIRRSISDEAPDRMLIAGFDANALKAAICARRMGIRIHQWSEEREEPRSPVRRCVRRLSLPWYDGVVATSSDSAEYFRRTWGIDPGRVETVLQNPAWPRAPAPPGGGGAMQLLYVGQLEPYKRVSRVIELLGLLRTQDVDARLAIVGSGTLEAALKDQAARSGLEDRVCFTGYVSDRARLDDLYRTSDVFVLASHETFGAVVVEALAHGLVLVSSRQAGATRDVVHEGRNGFVLDPDALDPAVHYLADLARRPAALLRAKRASLEIAARFGPEQLADRLIRFLGT
jgi:glycosyltransferase involved in cell wall biosynthesis